MKALTLKQINAARGTKIGLSFSEISHPQVKLAQNIKFEIEKMELDLVDHEQMQVMIDFLETNSRRWNLELSNSNPNCNLIDIEKTQRIFELEHQEELREINAKKRSGKIIKMADMVKENDFIHQKNCFIYLEIKNTLEQVAFETQTRSSISSSTATKFGTLNKSITF